MVHQHDRNVILDGKRKATGLTEQFLFTVRHLELAFADGADEYVQKIGR
jgi:hypothetical protein